MNEEKSEIANFEIVTTPTALESLERANIDMQIATAKRYPRSLAVVKKKMLDLATLDQETAASCFYRLNRQGRNIEGPTIRLAEIAVSSFGNLRYGARVISNDKKVITAQGYCFDLESNVMSQVEVQRRITDRNGHTYSDDMQVVTGNAACAIAARNAVFKVVPFAFIKPIFSAAKKAAVGDIKTLVERRTAMLQNFAALGVNDKRVLSAIGKTGIEEIGLAELETLIGLRNAIEDKEQTVEEAFPQIIARAQVPKTEPPTEKGLTPEPPTAENPSKKKLTRKKKEYPSSETPPNLLSITKLLVASGFSHQDFMEIALEQGWVTADQKWPLPEETLAQFIDPENWAVAIKPELEALKK
jgi:hypothetical protein